MKVRVTMKAMVAGAAAMLLPVLAEAQPVVHYHAKSTRKVAQITGDHDRPWGVPTQNLTATRAGMDATDLGSPVEHKGNLLLLFGDTWGGRHGLEDTWGVSSSTDPWNFTLQVPVAPDGKWRTIAPPGLNLGEYCVPSHGISVNDVLYVVFTQPGSDGAIMKRSWMISSADDGATWNTLYPLDNSDEAAPLFVNVWLEEHGDYIYMFGSGAYRASSPYLARATKADFPQKSAWEYYSYTQPNGSAQWTTDLAQASALFSHNQLGEFSSAWIDELACWVMLYNSASPRGITMRTAAQPWGPWSGAQMILSPDAEQAYGNYMHINWEASKQDLFSDPGRENEWGGEYAPYIIPRFTRGNAERCELYYTMSTWNPYQVVLMRSIVSALPPPAGPTTILHSLGHDRWARYPATVATAFNWQGRTYLTTFQGDENTGWLWQKLPRGTTDVSFLLHGGHAEVFLLEDSEGLPESGDVADVSAALRRGDYGRVARRASGVESNEINVTCNWSTRNVNADSLVLVVLDATTAPWGFVSVSDVRVTAPPAAATVEDWQAH